VISGFIIVDLLSLCELVVYELRKHLQDPKFPLALKKMKFMRSVIATIPYATGTQTPDYKIRATQIKMERKMLGET